MIQEVTQTSKQIASNPVFVSKPIKCYCNCLVFCIRVSAFDKWLCPVCEKTFDKDFQQNLDPKDTYDVEMGRNFLFIPDTLTGRWDIDDAEYLLIQVGAQLPKMW